MTAVTLRSKVFAGLVLSSLVAGAVRAQETSQGLFQKGFFLQTHERDTAGAAAAYERVAGDDRAPEALRSEARSRLVQCREDLASQDLARLMPPDALAYIEVTQPGEHVERLARMLGLVRDPASPDAAAKDGIPLGNGFFLPADFTISPALLADLKKFRGIAVAITRVDAAGMPDGVLVLHPGDHDLLRGLAETAVQFLEPAEAIGGFKTYRLHDGAGEFWVTVTARTFVAARSREPVAAAIERLKNPAAESLAARPEFQALAAQRREALLFAYANGRQLAKQFGGQLRGQEAAIATAVLDLDHLESLILVVGTSTDSVHLTAQMNLAPGHHNLAYNLIRTPPLSRRSLAHVPGGVAGVALVGLNAPSDAVARSEGAGEPTAVTGMDFGRELFANIEELAVFVLTPSGSGDRSRTPVPDVGVVFAVKDVAKSEAVWNQLLALAALVGVRDNQPRDITIEGQPGREYHFDGLPPIVVVRAPDRALVVGTRAAATAAIRAGQTKQGIAQDESFAKLLARLSPTSSKAVLVDGGRAVQTFRVLSGGGNTAELLAAGIVLKDLRLSIVSDEAPNQLTLRAEATGLPDVPSLLRAFAGQGGKR